MTGQRGRRCRRDAVHALFGGLEEFKDTLGRCEARLKEIRLRGDLRERHRELARVLDEGLHVPKRHRSGRDAVATNDRDADVVEVGQERHRRLDDPGQELRLEARRVQPLVKLVELRDGDLAPAEHLHQRVSRVHLLDMPVQRAGPRPLRDELLLRATGDDDGHDQREGDREDGDDGEQRTDPQHHREHADNGEE